MGGGLSIEEKTIHLSVQRKKSGGRIDRLIEKDEKGRERGGSSYRGLTTNSGPKMSSECILKCVNITCKIG